MYRKKMKYFNNNNNNNIVRGCVGPITVHRSRQKFSKLINNALKCTLQSVFVRVYCMSTGIRVSKGCNRRKKTKSKTDAPKESFGTVGHTGITCRRSFSVCSHFPVLYHCNCILKTEVDSY